MFEIYGNFMVHSDLKPFFLFVWKDQYKETTKKLFSLLFREFEHDS